VIFILPIYEQGRDLPPFIFKPKVLRYKVVRLWGRLIFKKLAIGSRLRETMSMATAINVGQLVVPDGLVGVYRVVGVSPDGQTADIEKFDVSTQKSLGDPIRTVAMNKLSAYEEDAVKAAARIVREAVTED
jgi:hypothetical protein